MLRVMKKALLLAAAQLLLLSLAACAPQDPGPPRWMPEKGIEIVLTLSTKEKVRGQVEVAVAGGLCIYADQVYQLNAGYVQPRRWFNPDHVVEWRQIAKPE